MLGTNDFRTERVHVAPKGGKFRIVPSGTLFKIKMETGGISPSFTNTRYTSLKMAEAAIQRYFDQNPKPEVKLTPEQEKRQQRIKIEE